MRRSALRRRLDGWRRDLAMVTDQLRGHPPPTVLRAPGPRPTSARARSPLIPRDLRVTGVEPLTPDAVAVRLEACDGPPLTYRAGQFLTVHLDVDGETLRRPYSFCTAPGGADPPTLGVKRVPGGRVSTRLVEGLRPGDRLRVTGPSGTFTLDPESDGARHLVMIAGGSGITPLLSLARSVLAAEAGSRVTLFYGNRAEDDVMFRDALDALSVQHEGQLVVDHVLHAPAEGWEGPTGMLDRATLEARLDALGVVDDATTEWLLCGPQPMMDAALACLAGRSVEPARIHEERFATPDEGVRTRRGSSCSETLILRLPDGRVEAALVRPGQTLLEAGLAAGLPLRFSCAMGGCGSCRVRLLAGDVTLDEPNCLGDDERQAGFVLACASHPLGPTTVQLDP